MAYARDHGHAAAQHLYGFGRGARSGKVTPFDPTKGGRKVDLSLRLNVLAACVAIAFVGAILLGAF